MNVNQEFPEARLTQVLLPIEEPGLRYRPSERFGPSATIVWDFKDSPFDESGMPRELSPQDIVVCNNFGELIPNYIFETDPERVESPDAYALAKAKLRAEVAKVQPRVVALVARQVIDRWGHEAYELAVVHEGVFIGSLDYPLKFEVGRRLIAMAQSGFVFTTTATLSVTEQPTVGYNPGLTTGLDGRLLMPELKNLKHYDPTEPGLFDL